MAMIMIMVIDIFIIHLLRCLLVCSYLCSWPFESFDFGSDNSVGAGHISCL